MHATKKSGFTRTNFTNKSLGGFTLIELLVSLALLSIVLVVGFGLLTTVNIGVRGTQAQRRVMDNLTFAIEQMSRAVTYGTNFSCIGGMVGNSCDIDSRGTDTLTFTTNYLGSTQTIVYSKKLDSSTGHGYIARSINSGPDLSLNDEKIDIKEHTAVILTSKTENSA